MTEQLPLDPDVDVETTTAGIVRPVHLRPVSLLVVAVGGACGTAARETLTLVIPGLGRLPLPIFMINVTGAFLLGSLLEALARRGPDHGRRRNLRLLLGTGFLGGYTTYSTLANDTAQLIAGGHAGTGVFYALATFVVGGLATWVGVTAAASYHRRTTGPTA